MSAVSFGRVDDDLNVYVIDAGTERRVGQMPGATAEAALAFYVRKYDDLAANVRLLEQRVAAKADPASLLKTAEKLAADLSEPSAVGDLDVLRARVAAIEPKLADIREAKREANKELAAAALVEREAIVVSAEKLAANTEKIIWKTASAEMTALFDKWQSLQKNGARAPKAEADALWKRFSAARNKFDSAKRTFFATQDSTTKAAKSKKLQLVAAAEAMVASGSDSTLEYRKLVDAWKAAGRTGGKGDDALWERFKAAGDAVFAVRSAKSAEIDASQSEALAAKLALLEEAKKIDPSANLGEAKKLLADIQKRWQAAGRVSREALRETDDKLKAIERKVRDEEQEHWRKSDPATKARTNDVAEKIEQSIAKLQTELAAATAANDSKKIADAKSALEAREAWLKVVLASAN